jgi:hypothetical protein
MSNDLTKAVKFVIIWVIMRGLGFVVLIVFGNFAASHFGWQQTIC